MNNIDTAKQPQNALKGRLVTKKESLAVLLATRTTSPINTNWGKDFDKSWDKGWNKDGH